MENIEEFLRQGFDPNALDDTRLVGIAAFLLEAARQRGLEVPHVAGEAAIGLTPNIGETDLGGTRERIMEQLPTAYGGYLIVSSALEGRTDTPSPDKNEATELQAALAKWLTPEKVAYVAELQARDPELRFTLVATPNRLVEPDELTELIARLGMSLGRHSEVTPEDLLGKYEAANLCKTDPASGNTVQFSLIPDKYTHAPGSYDEIAGALADTKLHGTAYGMCDALIDLKKQYPDAMLKVPSVLEAVTLWVTYATRAGSIEKAWEGQGAIRHFDLRVFKADDGSYYGLQSQIVDGAFSVYEYASDYADSAGCIAVG